MAKDGLWEGLDLVEMYKVILINSKNIISIHIILIIIIYLMDMYKVILMINININIKAIYNILITIFTMLIIVYDLRFASVISIPL